MSDHGYEYQVARKEFMENSLSDFNTPSFIKGWIQQEMNQRGDGGYWRSPPGFDVGHRIPGLDDAGNFRWEEAAMNRSRGGMFGR